MYIFNQHPAYDGTGLTGDIAILALDDPDHVTGKNAIALASPGQHVAEQSCDIIGSGITEGEEVYSSYEPRCEKTCLRGFRLGPTQTGLYSHRRWLEVWHFVYRKKRDFTTCVAKTKALISFAVTVKLIYVLVFAYAKNRFSHDAAHMVSRHMRV